jgi:hypothetical protein
MGDGKRQLSLRDQDGEAMTRRLAETRRALAELHRPVRFANRAERASDDKTSPLKRDRDEADRRVRETFEARDG